MTATPPTIEPPRIDEAMNRAFASIDALPAAKGSKAEAPAPEPDKPAPEPASPATPLAGTPTDAVKPVAAKPVNPMLDDLSKLSVPKTEAAKPAPETGKKKSSMDQFRDEYNALKAQHEEVLKWKAEHEPKIAELSNFDPKKVEEEWTGKLTAAETKALKAEEELRYANYQRSSEFKEKYEKPLIDAISSAQEDLKGITVKLADGTTRPATMADVESLQKMSLGQAAAVAAEAFGHTAPYVMKHRDRLNELHSLSTKAVEEYRTKGSEREAQMRQEKTKFQQETVKVYDSTIQNLETEFPEMFGADPNDPSSKEMLAKGTILTNRALKGIGFDPGLTPAELHHQQVEAQAHTAARARAYGVVYGKLQKSMTREAELTKKLEAYEKADPDPAKTSSEPSVKKQYKNKLEELTASFDRL